MKRIAYGAFASAIAALAMSMFFSSVWAGPREDWAKCLSGGEIPSAERILACTSALASGTDSWAASRAYYLRGRAHFDERDFEAAVADFSEFIHFYPSDVQGYQSRAAAYFRQRNFDLAIADYTRAIEINPKNPLADAHYAYVYRAEVYAAKQDWDLSIADSSKAIEINPKFQFAYCVRGHAYVARGDVERALSDYNKAIELDPEYKAAYAGRAAAYKIRGDLDLAIADYDQLIRFDSQDALAYFDRARVHWQSGSLAKSLADYDQAGRLKPKSAYVVLWREIVARRSGQPSRLTEAAAELDMTKWPAPIINLFLGRVTPEQVLVAADDSDQNKRKAQVCEANFYTAELALQHGSKEEAQRMFDRAAVDCPMTFIEKQAANVELGVLRAKR